MSTLPPPEPRIRRSDPGVPEPKRTPLGTIFLIIFVVIWALTALAVLANGGGAIDVVACAINGAFWGGIVVGIIWLIRKARK